MQRPHADVEELRRVEGQEPEQIEERRRIGRRKVLDPAEERRVAHVDRDEQHLVEREEDRDLQQDRPAAGERIDLLRCDKGPSALAAASSCRPCSARACARISRLQLLHLRHRSVLLAGEREERSLHEHRQDEDGDAEVVHDAVDEFHQMEERLRDEVEPAPVDQQVELQDAECALIAVQDLRLAWRRRRDVSSTFDGLRPAER